MEEVNNKQKEAAKIILSSLCGFFGSKDAAYNFLLQEALMGGKLFSDISKRLETKYPNGQNYYKNLLTKIINENVEIFKLDSADKKMLENIFTLTSDKYKNIHHQLLQSSRIILSEEEAKIHVGEGCLKYLEILDDNNIDEGLKELNYILKDPLLK
jgi:hypothetical protein